MDKKMKMAYVTTLDAHDIHSWSGLGYFIPETLKQNGFQIEYIDKIREENCSLLNLEQEFYRRFVHKRFLKDRHPIVMKSYARQIEKALSKVDVDVVLCPGTIPIANVKTKHPMVFWTDATFAGMIDFYQSFENLCKESIRHGNKIEQEALSKCVLAIYASDWAANTAIKYYKVDPLKVKVIPFGANISIEHSEEEITKLIDKKSSEICKLLFIGVDWTRKGGDIALETAKILNRRGLKTELHIVGCNPPIDLPEYVSKYGFVSKKTPEGKEIFDRLFSETHFLILPSRAEAFGIVCSEASSFGLPSLVTDIGGLSSVIKNGRNGQLFSLEQGAESYADYIDLLFSSKEQYRDLSIAAYQEYNTRLNWQTSGRVFRELIDKFCS
jgi:glycosyltransferase involved in cell wall biosynthesis